MWWGQEKMWKLVELVQWVQLCWKKVRNPLELQTRLLGGQVDVDVQQEAGYFPLSSLQAGRVQLEKGDHGQSALWHHEQVVDA